MKLEYFEGSSHSWSWRLFDDDNEVIANGAETFETIDGAADVCENMKKALGKNVSEVICTPLVQFNNETPEWNQE